MNYPRIYSLSTIGILKHYIHDYLFHSKRTDFIGSNGSGKSIISDLLQMIFVYDKDLIKFGTDGVKKEERNIHTLPYKTKYAYCFLNIEVAAAKFITVGIQISNQKGKRIIPFVLAKDPDLSKKLDQLSIEKSDIPFSKDLIKEKEILDIQDLAEYLYKTQNLRLVFFKSNDDIQGYYRFLFDKHILPLNLSQNKSLRAYAKVIQSFSKAKALNLSGNHASKNLKEFLFEESDEDIVSHFQKEQYELEKILKEYQSLNETIQTLANKQQKLIQLNELEQSCEKKYKAYKELELVEEYVKLEKLKEREKECKILLRTQKRELNNILECINRIPRVESQIRGNYNEANENLLIFYQFATLTTKVEALGKEISELRMLILPELDIDWTHQVTSVDISLRSMDDIKKEIAYATPYLKKYKILDKILKKRKEQIDVLDELKSALKVEKAQREKLLTLLSNMDEDSVVGWFLQNLPDFNEHQLQTVMHFAAVPVSEVQLPENSSKYLNTDELFNNLKAISFKNGIWLKLGPLYEYIKFNQDAALLQSKTDLSQSIQKLVLKKKEEISQIDAKLQALANVVNALPYTASLFEFKFDLSLVENSSIEMLKTSVACILQIDEKVSQLSSERIKYEEEILSIKSRFKVQYGEPGVVKKELEKKNKLWLSRVAWISKYSGTKGAQHITLEKDIKRSNDDLNLITSNVDNQQKLFDKLNESFYQSFKQNLVDLNLELNGKEDFKEEYDKSLTDYKSNYIGISQFFEETSGEKNLAVQLSIKSQIFSFKALEEALLGSRIRSTDDITTALHEANQTRTTIADGMRDSMIKIFNRTADRYDKYKEQIQRINTFFIDRRISGKFYFKLDFSDNKDISISLINQLAYKVRETATKGELQFGQSVVDFIEEFFRKQTRIKDRIPIDKLLDPKTFFELSAKLTDQFGEEVPGSTGETYSAIALLGIARLSVAQKESHKGLRFIILEELGSLDSTNFNTFPAIADEFQYQIITMAPHIFNIGFSDEWYAHHLIKGKENDKINYHPSASFFRTTDYNEDLSFYLNKKL